MISLASFKTRVENERKGNIFVHIYLVQIRGLLNKQDVQYYMSYQYKKEQNYKYTK